MTGSTLNLYKIVFTQSTVNIYYFFIWHVLWTSLRLITICTMSSDSRTLPSNWDGANSTFTLSSSVLSFFSLLKKLPTFLDLLYYFPFLQCTWKNSSCPFPFQQRPKMGKLRREAMASTANTGSWYRLFMCHINVIKKYDESKCSV